MIGWYLVVVALAAYRLTRVVTTDSITEAARDRLYRWAWIEPGEPGYSERYELTIVDYPDIDPSRPLARQGGARTYVNELFNCPWCLGVWVCAGLFVAWRWWDWMPTHAFVVVLALAGAQGFVASRADA